MTIAITLKVTDGLVVASDSATTLGGGNTGNVYNNAEKVFNLVKGERVAAAISGLGNIGPSSMASLIKDLRVLFRDDAKWRIDPKGYSVEEVAKKVKDFLFDEHYVPWHEVNAGKDRHNWPPFSMLMSGYSTSKSAPEIWQLVFDKGKSNLTDLTHAPAAWIGNCEAINRLVLGFDARIISALTTSFGKTDAEVRDALKTAAFLEAQIIPGSMPIQDAVDLAYFLVDTSAKYSRYTPGYQTIGGPIDIATITKHEGFKWVRRKHYYDARLNPERP